MRRLIFWGLVLLVLLEILVPNVDWINYKAFLGYAITGILFFLGAGSCLVKGNFYTKTSLTLPLLLYFFWLFISYLFSPFKSSSGYSFLNNSVLIVLYFLLLNALSKKEEISHLLNIGIFSALLICLYSFLYQEEFTGSFGNPNLFASFLVSWLPLALVRFYQTEEKEEKFLYFVSAIIFLISLCLTKSRGGIVAGIFSLVLFFGLGFQKEILGKREKWRKFSKILGILIILGLIFWRQIFKFFALKDRIYIWQGSLNLIREKWLFGWGTGNFPVYFPRFSPPSLRQVYPDQFVNNAHNEFLTLFAELGIIGLILFLWILGKVLRRIRESLRNEDNYVRLISLGALSSLSGVLLINLVDVSLRFLFTAIFFWFIIGILGSLERMEKAVPLEKSFLLKRVIIFLISLVLSSSLIIQAIYGFTMSKEYNNTVKQLKIDLSRIERTVKEAKDKIYRNEADAQTYFKLGTFYAKMMDWERAKEYLHKAISLDAKAIFAYTNLGNVYAEMHDLDKAIDCYRSAIRIFPDYLNARYNLGFVYFKKGEIEQALREFDFVLSKNKKDVYAWQMRQLIFE